MKREKLLKISIIFSLIMLMITSFVRAENMQEYKLEDIGMNISIDSSLIDIVSGLKNNDERLTSYSPKEDYINNFAKSGILLDAVDKVNETPSKEILVMKQEGTTYLQMQDLNLYEQNSVNGYYSQFIQSVSSQATESGLTVKSNELYRTQNGNVYFHIVTEGKIDDNLPVIFSTYYTIMNQKMEVISIRYYNTPMDETSEKSIIENITFDALPRDNSYQEYTTIVYSIVGVIVAVFAIAVLVIRAKDKRKLDKNITDKTLKSYKKFGGILCFFWLINAYQILLRIIDIRNVFLTSGLELYRTLVFVQSVVMILINIYLTILILKRNPKSVKKVKIALKINLAVTIILTVIRIIAAAVSQNTEVYTSSYYTQEVSIITSNLFYTVIWLVYLNFSQRVKIYYYINEKIDYKTFGEKFMAIKLQISNWFSKFKNKHKSK